MRNYGLAAVRNLWIANSLLTMNLIHLRSIFSTVQACVIMGKEDLVSEPAKLTDFSIIERREHDSLGLSQRTQTTDRLATRMLCHSNMSYQPRATVTQKGNIRLC
jgi:hypothetical protein